ALAADARNGRPDAARGPVHADAHCRGWTGPLRSCQPMSEPTVRVQGAGMPNRWMDLVSAAPWELPRYSERIARARQYVFTAVDDIRDSDLRGQVRAM